MAELLRQLQAGGAASFPVRNLAAAHRRILTAEVPIPAVRIRMVQAVRSQAKLLADPTSLQYVVLIILSLLQTLVRGAGAGGLAGCHGLSWLLPKMRVVQAC